MHEGDRIQTRGMPVLSHAEVYRPDIDGLRALAIVSVIGFHAFPRTLPGGFIGVDIFFVISGYLISGIIFRSIDKGEFRYADFYGKRIRRIFPALAIVLLTCIIAGYFLFFPTPLAQLGLQVVGGSLFFSNILLWTQSGYFDPDSATKPLLHLWSLGIEEQYYLIWPILLSCIGVSAKKRSVTVLSLLALSLILNLVFVSSYPVATFYLPSTRIWELLIGALLSLTIIDVGPRATARTRVWLDSRDFSNRVRAVIGWLGAGAILLALFSLRDTDPFPGWRALLPTVGAALLIIAGPSSWVNSRILCSRPAVAIGLISYPLYLWHWPMLVFPAVTIGGLPRSLRVASVVMSIVLAFLTYRYVERPVRSAADKKNVTRWLLVSVCSLACLGGWVFLSRGVPERYPLALRQVALADQTFDYQEYRETTCFLQPKQTFRDFSPECVDANAPDKPLLIVLWGDSHAASLYPGLRTLIDRNRLPYRLAQFTAAACPPVTGFSLAKRPNCSAENDFTMKFIEREKPETVVLLASWSFYSGSEYEALDDNKIASTIRALRDFGVKNVLLIGPLPRWLEHQPNVALRAWDSSHSIVVRSWLNFDPRVRQYSDAMKVEFSKSVTYISPIDSLCDADGCPILLHESGSWLPVSWDDAHLTQQGSELVGKLLLPYLSHATREQ